MNGHQPRMFSRLGIVWESILTVITGQLKDVQTKLKPIVLQLSASCAGGAGVQSEQNWQANAHSLLRKRLDADTTDPTGVYTFHFRTKWEGASGAAAAHIEYYDASGGFIDKIGKRSDEATHFVIEGFHTNGTTSVLKRRLTDREVSVIEFKIKA